MENVIKFLEHLKQPSTIKGITLLLGLAGIIVPTETINAIVTVIPLTEELIRAGGALLVGGTASWETIRNEFKNSKKSKTKPKKKVKK